MDKEKKTIDEKFSINNNSDTDFSTPGFSGFSTGKGTPLKPPSEATKLKAASLFEDLKDRPPSPSNSLSPSPPPTITRPPAVMGGFTTGNGKKLKPVSEQAKRKAEALLKDIDEPPMTGFTTGSGNTLKPVSEDAKRKAMDLFKDDILPTNSGFTTGSGNILKQPSEKAIKDAAKLFEEPEANKKRTADGDLKYDKVINQYGGFQMGNSKKNIDVSSQSKRKAISVINDKKESPSPSFISPKRNVNRITEVKKQNRQFKSPIIQSNVELTKAAVSNRNVTRNRATPVFDLTGKCIVYKLMLCINLHIYI